ncbi:hypothetical protein F2Q70_00020531 [Brassica cretica]|uniref:Uncharacterized protein n=1 Tax=Brassica cretica TaxID=69181 RepID=A0A8S9GXL4_BRACR|nr:hypothetical protein F2Q70_00020531 [Brassica cretica]
MSVLLKSGQSASRDKAVEEMKDCRSTVHPRCRSTVTPECGPTSPKHRSTTPTESTASYNAVRIMTHEEFAARHPHPPSLVYVNIDRQTDPAIDQQRETTGDGQPPAPIEPQPKPSSNPPETTSTHSEDAAEPMEVDKAPIGRTLRKRKEKVAKHLKRGANEKEMESFRKRVFRIPLEKPFEGAYFTHRLWMFFRETKKTERTLGECSMRLERR